MARWSLNVNNFGQRSLGDAVFTKDVLFTIFTQETKTFYLIKPNVSAGNKTAMYVFSYEVHFDHIC